MEEKRIEVNGAQANINILKLLEDSPLKNENNPIGFDPATEQKVCTSTKYVIFDRGEKNSAEEVQYFLVLHILKVNWACSSEEQVEYKDGIKKISSYIITVQEFSNLIENSIAILNEYLKDVRQFDCLLSKKLNENAAVQSDNFCHMLTFITRFVSLLNELNYVEEALKAEKLLRTFLRKLSDQLNSNKLKFVKDLNIYRKDLDKHYMTVLQESAYSYFQLENFIAAGLASAEAKKIAENFHSNRADIIKTKYEVMLLSVLAVYHINEGDITDARKLLDEALSIFNKYLNSLYQVWNVNNLIYAANKLAQEFYKANDLKNSIKYFQQAYNIILELLSHKLCSPTFLTDIKIEVQNDYLQKRLMKSSNKRLLSNHNLEEFAKIFDQLKKKLEFLKPKLFKNNSDQLQILLNNRGVIPLLNECKPFTINTEKQLFLIHFKDATIARQVHKKLDKKYSGSFKLASEKTLVISNLINIETKTVCSEIKNAKIPKRSLRILPAPEQQRAPSLENDKKEGCRMVSSYTLLSDSYNLYTKNPSPKKKMSKHHQLEDNEEKTVENKSSDSVIFIWQEHNISSKLIGEKGPVYELSNKPYIPEGHWYAYLNEEKFKELDPVLISSLKSILERGKLSDKGQGIVYAKQELDNTKYLFKIKLLGKNGKGDVRVYGYIAESTTFNASVKKLIIFDQFSLHAHKKHHIEPKGVRPD